MIFNFIRMQSPLSDLARPQAHESRCQCGSLLARLRQEGVELKCRRCKRVVVIPWGQPATWHKVSLQWQDSELEGETATVNLAKSTRGQRYNAQRPTHQRS